LLLCEHKLREALQNISLVTQGFSNFLNWIPGTRVPSCMVTRSLSTIFDVLSGQGTIGNLDKNIQACHGYNFIFSTWILQFYLFFSFSRYILTFSMCVEKNFFKNFSHCKNLFFFLSIFFYSEKFVKLDLFFFLAKLVC